MFSDNNKKVSISMFRRRFLAPALKVVAMLFVAVLILLPGKPAECNEYGCSYNNCDSNNPCNIGCSCTYPEGVSVGYCK